MSYPRRLIPLITLLSVAAAGCQFLPQAGNKETPATTKTESTSSAKQPSINQLPPEQNYDLQVNVDQVWARLTKVVFTDTSIIATLAVTNGSKQVIELNPKDDMFIRDDYREPNQYNLLAPPENRTIAINPGDTLTGNFVFIGRLATGVNEMTLYINASSSPRSAFEPWQPIPTRPYMWFKFFIQR